jgi:HEAT repeat protein
MLVRVNAARSLSQLKDERAVVPLTAALLDQTSPVRKQAAASLDALSWKPVTDEEITAYMIALQKWSEVAKMGSAAVEPLITCLDDEEWVIRKNAAEQLGNLADSTATPALLDTLQRYSDGQTFNAALGALVKISDPQCVDQLYALLEQSSDKGVRRSIAEAFGDMGLAEAVDGLCKLIHDDDLNLRAAIIKSLGAIRHPRAVPALISMLEDNTRLKAAGVLAVGPRINFLASEALKAIGSPDAESALQAWKKNDGRKGFWPFGKR